MNNPFSQRLNTFVSNWFTANIHLFCMYPESVFNFNDVNETFKAFTEHFNTYGTIPVWVDNNEDNIFGDVNINAMFRGWHDYMHVKLDRDFSLQGEIDTFRKQREYLPEDWKFERMLMQSEIVGQAMFYTLKRGATIESQREFTENYIARWGVMD